MFTNFFARAKKFVINYLLTLSFNLVTWFCKQQEVIEDNNNNLFEELFCFNRFAYSSNNKRELRELLTTR